MSAASHRIFFKAYRADGEVETGHLDATDEVEAVRLLRQAGKTPFQIAVADGGRPLRESSSASKSLFERRLDLARFFDDVAVMLGAGFTVDVAVLAAAEAESDAALARRALRIHRQLTEGQGVAEAFAVLPEMSDEAIALLASGENSGRLEVVVAELARSYALRVTRQREVRAALVYPSFLVLAMFFALLLLSLYLAPALEPIFDNAGQQPPLVVRALLAFGDFVSGFGIGLLALAAIACAGLVLAARSRGGRARLSAALARLPLVSGPIRSAANARYLKTMALLIGNGVPLLEAMRLGAETAALPARRSGLLAARQRVSEGAPFWQAIDGCRLFPKAVISLVRLGEQSNNLAPMLTRAGAAVDMQLQRRIDRTVTLLTPALTLLMGAIVGGLVISVLTTLLSINEIALQ